MVILTEEQAKKYVINTKESGLPFGPEDVVEVTKYGHLDVNCGRIEATVILNSGDKLIKLEALKRRWEFQERYYDDMKQFINDYPKLYSMYLEESVKIGFKEWFRKFCIGSLLIEKGAESDG